MHEQANPVLTLDSIRELISPVLGKHGVIQATVFGSYARGEANALSDVDIVIDSEGKLSGMAFFVASDEISKALPIPTDIYEKREIRNGTALYDRIKEEGVILYER